MSKRLSFDIEYQKEIDRCKHKVAVLSADGQKAGFLVASLNAVIEFAEDAKADNNTSEMVFRFHQMKEFTK